MELSFNIDVTVPNMSYRYTDVDHSPGSVGDVLRLIRASETMSRATLARITGLAASTVSLRVDVLIGMGLVREHGNEDSHGGRPARRLQLDGEAGFVAVVDLGANHVRILLNDLTGQILIDREVLTEAERRRTLLEEGPAATVEVLWRLIETLSAEAELPLGGLRGIAIGVPAPVEYPSGRIATPSFQPSWHGADLAAAFAKHVDIPVLVENDANLIALFETNEHGRSPDDQLLAVKLGTRIGCGIIAGGRLHRGVGGAAGEVSHTPIDGTAAIPCTCGIPNCLESVSSGGAIVARLRAAGHPVLTTQDVLALGARGDTAVIDALRDAGTRIGQVLANIVNFFNPREVVLAGSMSASPLLVAAIRGELYQKCLPLVTEKLEVRASRSPRDAGIRGASVLILDEVLAPARIDAQVRDAADGIRDAG